MRSEACGSSSRQQMAVWLHWKGNGASTLPFTQTLLGPGPDQLNRIRGLLNSLILLFSCHISAWTLISSTSRETTGKMLKYGGKKTKLFSIQQYLQWVYKFEFVSPNTEQPVLLWYVLDVNNYSEYIKYINKHKIFFRRWKKFFHPNKVLRKCTKN